MVNRAISEASTSDHRQGPYSQRRVVFVSGCYDILHAGHIQFFTEARALGDFLIVSFASSDVLYAHKRRRSSLPDDHKKALIQSLRMVDEVVVGYGPEPGLDFKDDFLRIRPEFLVVTDDDRFERIKRDLCAEIGCQYVRLTKTPPLFTPISTTEIVRRIRAPSSSPLRVDFAGGWLDVPRFARPGAVIVNCAIAPTVTLTDWPYELKSGLGGSAAWAALNGKDGVVEELNLGVGWQDPAIIGEGGLCVWRSGDRPVLEGKFSGSFLLGRMALYWTGITHDTPGAAHLRRDYDQIAAAGALARDAAWRSDFDTLAEAVRLSYAVQLGEGMQPLPSGGDHKQDNSVGAVVLNVKPAAFKYCGGGHGGYAVYLFVSGADRDQACHDNPLFRPIEPCSDRCR